MRERGREREREREYKREGERERADLADFWIDFLHPGPVHRPKTLKDGKMRAFGCLVFAAFVQSCECFVPSLKSSPPSFSSWQAMTHYYSLKPAVMSTRNLKSISRVIPIRSSSKKQQPQASIVDTSTSDLDIAKRDLFDSIKNFKQMQARDGKVSVDFGVSGGELDKETRAPRNLAENGGFYATSEAVGRAADIVFQRIRKLETLNPTSNATKYFGTGDGELCPLHGEWRLLFTTAADASFSPNSSRGDAQASNIVDAVKGKITNIIDFLPRSDGRSRSLEQLKVRLIAEAESPTRIGLRFKYITAKIARIFGLPLFGKRISIVFPVPGPFITRIFTIIRRVKDPPKAYFDVIFLDEDLRIHKTGEGNIFVQGRPEWISVMDLNH